MDDHLLWKEKNCHVTKKGFENPSVGYCRGNNIMFEPYGRGLCYEPIPWSLVIV